MKRINYQSDIENEHASTLKAAKGRKPIPKEDLTRIGFNAICYALDIYRKFNPNIKDKVITVRFRFNRKYIYLVSHSFGEYFVLDGRSFGMREISTRYDVYLVEEDETLKIDGDDCGITLKQCIVYAVYALQGKEPQCSTAALDIALSSLPAIQKCFPKRAMLRLYNYNMQVLESDYNMVIYKVEDIYDIEAANYDQIKALYI